MASISSDNSKRRTVRPLTDEQRQRVEANFKLVYHVIKHYGHRWNHLSNDEILSECMFALMKASRNFDESLGYKFSTFACYCMLRHTSSVNAYAMSSEKHFFHRSLVQFEHDLDSTVDGDSLESFDSREEVEQILSLVRDKKDRSIIRRRVFDGDDFPTIAKSLNRTCSNVSYRYHCAIKKLKVDLTVKSRKERTK